MLIETWAAQAIEILLKRLGSYVCQPFLLTILILKYLWHRSTIQLMIYLSKEHPIPNIDVSAKNLKSTVSQIQYHIQLVKYLHQALFRTKFHISGVGVWVLVYANTNFLDWPNSFVHSVFWSKYLHNKVVGFIMHLMKCWWGSKGIDHWTKVITNENAKGSRDVSQLCANK